MVIISIELYHVEKDFEKKKKERNKKKNKKE